MGVWDEVCLICAGPLRNNIDQAIKIYDNDKTVDEYEKLKQISRKLNSPCQWLNDLYIISSTEKTLITNGKSYTETGSFVIDKELYIVTPLNWHMDWNFVRIGGKMRTVAPHYGIVCHKDCYKLLHNKLNYKLQFADVSRLLALYSCHLKKDKIYAPGHKYIRQDYDYVGAVTNSVWILYSPLKNKENESRLLKIWTPLVKKFKSNPPRPSPSESATYFKPGTILNGYNGRKYIVKKVGKTKKWFLYIESK